MERPSSINQRDTDDTKSVADDILAILKACNVNATGSKGAAHPKESSMSKIISALAFATLLSLPASAAPASANCPALEGYPDCHPETVYSNSYREYPRDRSR